MSDTDECFEGISLDEGVKIMNKDYLNNGGEITPEISNSLTDCRSFDRDKDVSFKHGVDHLSTMRLTNQIAGDLRKVYDHTIVVALVRDNYGKPIYGNNVIDDTGETLIHAEEVLLAKLRKINHADANTVYITAAPCLSCAMLLVMAGYEKVLISNPFSISPKWHPSQIKGLNYLLEHKVEWRAFSI